MAAVAAAAAAEGGGRVSQLQLEPVALIFTSELIEHRLLLLPRIIRPLSDNHHFLLTAPPAFPLHSDSWYFNQIVARHWATPAPDARHVPAGRCGGPAGRVLLHQHGPPRSPPPTPSQISANEWASSRRRPATPASAEAAASVATAAGGAPVAQAAFPQGERSPARLMGFYNTT